MPPEAAAEASARGTVAVTGATGFIGRHLVRALAQAGWRVRMLVRRDPAGADWGGLQLELVGGDLRNADAVRQLVSGVDAVVHLAGVIKAPTEDAFMRVNCDATRALAEATAKHAPAAAFHGVSSLAAREPELSTYARSKRAGEDAILQVLGARAGILRPAAVYGPGDRETLVFFQLAGMPRVPLLGNDRARLTVIHVADLCAAIVDAVAAGPNGQVRTVCDARADGYGWRELMAAAAAAIGRPHAKQIRLPRVVLRSLAGVGDVAHRFGNDNMLSSEKLRELLHEDWSVGLAEQYRSPTWRPRFDLHSGFIDAASWYRDAGWLPAG
ncbi:NAD-dependent epimerase/dehydratase family protein [Solimonas marina]|uniref:NAD-dependent epimerase/dehydratase family protein n=1 Tax=Solimonas marina TaxID=2714601 RepID=A0A970B753_9GAMM|nr:NAD-dependent epimerase/dehydratase family protein [Solimonas marina]